MPNLSTTTAVQDYLKAIYQLGRGRDGVPTSALAERLGVSPASVSGMLKRLDEQGLVSHKRYQGVRLTKRGRSEAVEMIRHHRLLELYLTKVVGMAPDLVHAEADALEHVISEELESRLDELLGFPTEDPHGHPIPTRDLVLNESEYPSLDEVAAGTRCVIRRVSDRDPAILRFLATNGLEPGSKVKVLGSVPFGGGVRVVIKGAEIIIGSQAAVCVYVEVLGTAS